MTDPQLPPAVSKTAPNAERAEQGPPPSPERAPDLPDGEYSPTFGYTDEEQQMLAAIRRAHYQVRSGAIDDDYERGRAHALDDVARVLLPRLHPERDRTFAFRPAGEDENVTVALDDLGSCPVCGHDVHPGAFAVWMDDPDAHGWAHESCARPQNPTRPALNAEQTRNRS